MLEKETARELIRKRRESLNEPSRLVSGRSTVYQAVGEWEAHVARVGSLATCYQIRKNVRPFSARARGGVALLLGWL